MEHPHAAMRRKEREITDRSEIDAILNNTRVMHLAMAAQNMPFLVPLYFVYTGEAIYFHSAKVGTKMGILKENPQVCFEVSQDLGFMEADEACDFEARHKTVIGTGRASMIENAEEKIKILHGLMARFTEKQYNFPQANVDRTAVVRIDIESIKGKCHGV